MKRTITRKGRAVTFDDKDRPAEQAMSMLEAHIKSTFARSLVEQYRAKQGRYSERLSEKQWDWVHYLISEIDKPATKSITSVSVERIYALLTTSGLKFPRLRFEVFGVKLTFKKVQSMVVLMSGKKRLGYADSQGILVPDLLLKPRVFTNEQVAAIAVVNADPLGCAILHGHKTGICCFCGRLLETKESVSAGYGPICAEQYGLPWGDIKPENTIVGIQQRLKEQFPAISI